jgi:HlyD family secretion protein
MSKRKRKYLLLLILLPILAVPLLKGGGEQVPAVQVTVARLGSLEERSDGSGTLEGIRKVEISAATAGTIDSILVQEGDTVSAGQLLLTLETTQASAGLDQAQAQVRSASIALAQSLREQTRIQALRDAGLASLEEATSTDESVQLCQAELERSLASRTLAQSDLDNTTCSSPIDGVVTALNVEEGEVAVVGTMNNAGTVLLTIEDMSCFMVRVTMVESEIVDVRPGMQAEITLDALPDTSYAGEVERVGLSSSNDAGGEEAAEYEVLIRLESPDARMRSGMSASVEVLTARNESCIIVPIQCIVQRQIPGTAPGTNGTAVLHPDHGRITVVPVETGITGVMEIEVTGINPGDTLVSGPTEMLRTLQDGYVLGSVGSGSEEGNAISPGAGPGPGFMPPGR